MKHSPLNDLGNDISELCLGCWTFGGGDVWGEQPLEDSIQTVKAAFDHGINIFDTAEFYNEGRSEACLGEALKGIRPNVYVATKAWQAYLGKDKLMDACENSLKRLKTDYIDLYQVHWANQDIPLEETFTVLEKLKADGKIRAYGICNFGPQDIAAIDTAYTPVSNQVAYNLFFRAVEFDIIAACQKRDISILAYSPLAQGVLTGKYMSIEDVPEGIAATRLFSKERARTVHSEEGCEQEVFVALKAIRNICKALNAEMGALALSWLCAKNEIRSVVVGARKPEQIIDNIQAASVSISNEVIDKLNAISEPIKQKIGPNADMWRTESRIK